MNADKRGCRGGWVGGGVRADGDGERAGDGGGGEDGEACADGDRDGEPGGAPPFARDTRSGGDGAFQTSGLAPGSYTIGVQVAGEFYLDPCDWDAKPATVTVAAGQSAAALEWRLAEAVVEVEVEDEQNLLRQRVRDGRRRELSVGVRGPAGAAFSGAGAEGRGRDGPGA